MKVDGTGSVGKGIKVETPNAQKPFELEGVAEAEKKLKGVSKETVELSERAELAKRLTEAAKAAPDIRKDKIEQLKREIESGSYSRPSKAIAEKMIQETVDFLKPTQ